MTFSRRTRPLIATAGATVNYVSDASLNERPGIRSLRGRDHPFYAEARKPEVIAHRGGNGQWPGETMLAMRNAVRVGADILEMDVYRTKDVENGDEREDGELVLMHDISVNKTTQGTRRVYEYDVSEIQQLNAGYHWSPDGGESLPYHDPDHNRSLSAESPNDLRVPTLREVFEEFPHMRMVVEMKCAPAGFSPARKLCELIRSHGMQKKVLVASMWFRFMNEFRELCPEVATSATVSLHDLISLLADKTSAPNESHAPDAVELPYQIITPWVVKKAGALNKKLHAWTVNDLVKMYDMKTLDVDGIITDYPEPLLSLLDRR